MRRVRVVKQPQGVRQNRQDSRKGGGRATGSAWEVDDECAAQKSANASAEDGERRFPAALGTHLLAQTVEQPGADGAGGLRGDVALGETGTASGDDELGEFGCFPQGVLDQQLLVWKDAGAAKSEVRLPQQSDNGRPGKVFAFAPGTTIADGKHKRRERAAGCACEIHGFDCTREWPGC